MKQKDYLIKIEETTSFLCKTSQIIEKSFPSNHEDFCKERMLEKTKNTINELMELKAVITNEGVLTDAPKFEYSKENRFYTQPISKLTEKETKTFLDDFVNDLIKVHNWFEGASLDKLIVYPSIRMNTVKTEALQDLERSCLLRLIGITIFSDFKNKPKQEGEKENCEIAEAIDIMVKEASNHPVGSSFLNNGIFDEIVDVKKENVDFNPVFLNDEVIKETIGLTEAEPENPHTELPPQ